MKKGDLPAKTLVTIIIVLISLIAVLSVMGYIFISLKARGYDRATCMMSVIANSKWRMPVSDQELWAVDCPTVYIRFVEDGYTQEIGNNDPVKVPFKYEGKDVTLRDCKMDGRYTTYEKCRYLEKVNEVIASEIWACWEQYGAGKLSVFSSYETASQCAVCAVIEFDPEVQSRFGENSYSGDILPDEESLNGYMHSNSPGGRDITYYDFVQDPLDHYVGGEYYDYSFGRSYALVFAAHNEHYLKGLLSDALSFIQEKILKIEVNDDVQRFMNAFYYIEQQEVTQYCDVLANHEISG